jgi:YggT family protein
MQVIGYAIYWALWIFLLILFARMIFSWIPMLRKVLKPVRIGNVMLDLAFLALAILVSIAMRVNQAVFF